MSTPPPPPPTPSAPPPAGAGPAPERSFQEAVQVCLSKYADFSGRASRSEYWFWVLGVLLASIVAGAIDAVATGGLLQAAVGLGTLVPGLAAAVRRLHDTGRGGAWLLIFLIPLVGAIVLIVFLASGPDESVNEYG